MSTFDDFMIGEATGLRADVAAAREEASKLRGLLREVLSHEHLFDAIPFDLLRRIQESLK